ncbi:hypothetical protein ACGGAQ_04700 [Micromonospora sp. NPDC047557]
MAGQPPQPRPRQPVGVGVIGEMKADLTKLNSDSKLPDLAPRFVAWTESR